MLELLRLDSLRQSVDSFQVGVEMEEGEAEREEEVLDLEEGEHHHRHHIPSTLNNHQLPQEEDSGQVTALS